MDNGLATAQAQFDKQEPPVPEEQPRLLCDECRVGIYENEEYYVVDDRNICGTCMDNFILDCKRIA